MVAVLTLALLACAPPSDAERYAGALAADTYDAAWAACAAIVGAPDRADCMQTTSARFARFDGCDAIAEETWREECRFAEAEHLARTGDRAAAVRACGRTRYAKNCQSHVLDGLAMEVHAREVPEAAAALAALVPGLAAAQVQSEFWTGYFRIRMEKGLGIDPAACADRWCEAGARRSIRRVVGPMRRDRGDVPPPDFPWATSASAREEIARAWAEPPPGPPPPGHPKGRSAAPGGAPGPGPAAETPVAVEPARQTE
ncbi:MAG: hypothetical protein ACK4YP_09660 [Myxococcota bacterium]